MVTGFEVGFYRSIDRIAERAERAVTALEAAVVALERIADAMEGQYEGYDMSDERPVETVGEVP